MTPTTSEVAEKDLSNVALYTPWDAARYLHIPVWAVFAHYGRNFPWRDPEWFFFRYGAAPLPPVDDDLPMPPYGESKNRLTFHDLADLFVRAAGIQALAERPRDGRADWVRWEKAFHSVWRGMESGNDRRIQFDDALKNGRMDALIAPYQGRLADEQVALLRKWFNLRLERIEAKDGRPTRIFPFSRTPVEGSPRLISMDPRIRFGRPVLTDRGVPTDILFERHQAGDTVADLAKDYDIAIADVEEAIRYEAMTSIAWRSYFG